ncbi:MAG: hypothetical protein OXT03_03390 [Alphaproteobacteria bacterium]|nr:hypothetical protein [Alphaproteobacteria bacterium]
MMNKVKKVFLVTSVKKKSGYAALAKDLYISPLFKKSRKYVEPFNMPWFILSEEYGLLSPDKKIKPYEKTLKKMNTKEKKDWAERVISQMENNLPEADEIIILAGKNYYKNLFAYLEENYKKVTIPMGNLGIGERLKWLNERINHI